MGFLIHCPNCGPRSVYEFKFAGEQKAQPGPGAGSKEWRHYFYFNRNVNGPNEEWWYHSGGCGAWLRVNRDTATNRVMSVERASDKDEG